MQDRAKQEFIAKCVRETLAIVERLYKRDRARYKPLYGCVNRAIKQHRSPVLVLQAVKRLEEKDSPSTPSSAERVSRGAPASDVIEYFFGALRKLEQEREAKRLRAGTGATSLGEILNRAMERAKDAGR